MHGFTKGGLRFAPCLLAFALANSSAVAQTSRGTVTGLIIDSQKASIGNAAVDLTNASTLAEVGRIAVGSAILCARDPGRAARELRALVERA